MSDWIEMPKTKSVDLEVPPSDDQEEWKYRVYIPVPAELVKQLKVGETVSIELKGDVRRLSITEEAEGGGSSEVCLRVKAVKLPEKKSAMEAYAASLDDD